MDNCPFLVPLLLAAGAEGHFVRLAGQAQPLNLSLNVKHVI